METVKLSQIRQDELNANAHTERGTYMLRKSMERFGFLEPGVLDANNRIIGGNNRTETAADILDADEAIVIDIDGRTPVFVRRTDLDLTTPEGREAAIALNRTAQVGIEFDPAALGQIIGAGVDVSDWFHPIELEIVGVDADIGARGAGKSAGDYTGRMAADDWELPDGVPDTIWPTDNDYDIPALDEGRQADAFDQPIETWGAKGRGRPAGVYHFYTEDYRFRAIWYEPDKLLGAGCVSVVEPNFSVYDNAPFAIAIWNTYKKRWLARYWQSRGVRVFVDLNVGRRWDAINLLGVPAGWKSYATRGYTDRLAALDAEYEIAAKHAGSDDGLLFMVYGGGGAVRDWCKGHAALWVPEDMDRAKGRYLGE